MRREWFILVLFIALTGLVLASINVKEVTDFKKNYTQYEKITGKVNLTISDENYNTPVRSNNGGEVLLGDLLNQSGFTNFCTPTDCSQGYTASGASASKIISLGQNKAYIGFTLTGQSVEISSLNLSLLSNFGISDTKPLSFIFFEGESWNFSKYSNSYSDKNWGCYDSTQAVEGPIIGSTTAYCEIINLSETSSVKLGADVSGDTVDLKAKIYYEDGTSFGSCTFNSSTGNECTINADEGQTFPEGTYHVCITSTGSTNYKIKEENSATGGKCGFVYSSGPGNNVKDYAIFASTAKYADSGEILIKTAVFENAVDSANEYIENKYGGNCSNGCILPIEITGITQSLTVNDIKLDYNIDGEIRRETNAYDLIASQAKINFDGIIDLEKTNFNISKEGEFTITIGNEEILSEDVTLLPSSKIKGFYPFNPPAGVPIRFYVDVENITNLTMQYEWTMGDGSAKKKTTERSVTHIYDEIKNYTINVKVTEGNYTASRDFIIETISPLTAISDTLVKKTESLNEFKKSINKSSNWYDDNLKDEINITYYEKELIKINDSVENADNDSELIEIAENLFSLGIPSKITKISERGKGLFTEVGDINPSIIAEAEEIKIDEDKIDKYSEAILGWQDQNIKSNITTQIFSITYDNLETEEILRVYEMLITSKISGESFLVINLPKEEINFQDVVESKEVGGSTVITLASEESTSINFFYTSPEEATFFVSPSLDSLVLGNDVDTKCNYNKICEKDSGENSKNCRADCKPIGKIILYIVLAILLFLLLYTILQVWYKRNYEAHLFGDRRHLYNLLMFIDNARAQGRSDSEIRTELKKKNWSGERITYAINKSRGKSNGLYEIIPIDWIGSKTRARKAQNTTFTQQQNGANFNKYGFQRPLR